MAKYQIKPAAITRTGYEYQDLAGIELLIRQYRDPELYAWVLLEADDTNYRALDDVESSSLPRRAFFSISRGHPLHLIYAYEELIRAGRPTSAEEVELLPPCPDGDIRTYYRGLWVRLSAYAKNALPLSISALTERN